MSIKDSTAEQHPAIVSHTNHLGSKIVSYAIGSDSSYNVLLQPSNNLLYKRISPA